MARVTIVHEGGFDYGVTVDGEHGRTSHVVTVWPSDVDRYAPGATPEALIDASFEFLLAREPQSAIMGRFELPVIERFFPEYLAVIGSLVKHE